MFISASEHLSVFLFISASEHLSIFLFISASEHVSFFMFISASEHLSIFLFISASEHVGIFPFISASEYPSVFLFISGSLHLRARLHEPELTTNPGQVASPGPPFSSQTLATVQAFDWKKVDPGWRPDPGWFPTRVHVNGPLVSFSSVAPVSAPVPSSSLAPVSI